MPEPLTPEYLKRVQKTILGVPKGPWTIEPSEHGLPDQVGPICFLETWSDQERVPVIEFISFSREAMPALFGEVARQSDVIRSLERRIRALEATQPKAGVRHG